MNKVTDRLDDDGPEIVIHQEVDIPLESSHSGEKLLSEKDVASLEKMTGIYKDLHGITLKDKSFRLIIILGSALLALYGVDVLLKCLGLPNSDLLNSLFEFLKVTISTLIGFTFSNNKLREKE